MSDTQGYTAAGAVFVAALGLVPRIFDRLTGKHKDKAVVDESVASASASVIVSAMALLRQHEEDAKRAQEAEEKCRRDMAAVEARCDALESEVSKLRALHADDATKG